MNDRDITNTIYHHIHDYVKNFKHVSPLSIGWHTGSHGSTYFDFSINYKGNLHLYYDTGTLVISGGYSRGYHYYKFFHKMMDYMGQSLYRSAEKLPSKVSDYIKNKEGMSSFGFVIYAHDPTFFEQIETAIDVFLTGDFVSHPQEERPQKDGSSSKVNPSITWASTP